jgi:hypothetical protein
MQNTEPVPVVPSSRLLKSDIVTNILAFLGILFLLLILSSSAIYFVGIAVPPGNSTLTNVLISLIITGTLGSLIGAVTFVTITMTRQANEQITIEFSAAKALAVSNQNEAKALAIANQTKLEALLTSAQSEAKTLAVSNQNEAKALAVANQTALQTLIQNEFLTIRREIAGLKPISNPDSQS